MTISPTMKIIGKIHQKIPKDILKLIGWISGTDHRYRINDLYFTQAKQLCCTFYHLQNGPGVYIRCKEIHVWVIEKLTPCTIQCIYKTTVVVAKFGNLSLTFEFNNALAPKKFIITRRNDFREQTHLEKYYKAPRVETLQIEKRCCYVVVLLQNGEE